MTHNELLTKIEKQTVHIANKIKPVADSCEKDIGGFANALRAVVELHKPKEEDGKLWCEHEVCYNHIEFLERDDCDCSYPCPTIQAIEKELG
jgi:hypothetical protein